nr:MAG: ORF1 [Torque teno midi virus]
MPFWWRRRRKPWYGRWRNRRRFQRYKRRKPRRRFTRRRNRTTTRRRRRRRYKVRRKKKKIPIFQWQPDSIVKCHIKGNGLLVLGCEGTQMYCYTKEKFKYIPPKVPYGGGLGVEKFTLNYLYEEYQYHNNIWTASNVYKDLLRYLYCRFTFYRHPDTDFIIKYNRQPPFEINKYTYAASHPHLMLLEKHKKIILSKQSKPNGKYKVKVLVKPPKQMLTKWFFTKQFADFGLLLLTGAALNLRYSHLSASNENLLVNITSLNPYFYQHTNWASAHAATTPYKPWTGISQSLKYSAYVKENNKLVLKDFELPTGITTNHQIAISYDNGWFSSKILKAVEWKTPTVPQATRNIIYGRYNPTKDKGPGNKIYIISILADTWGPPTHDKMVLLEDLPLWLGIYGYISYLQTVKPGDWLASSLVVLQSESIYCYNMVGACTTWAPIDQPYIDGKQPYDLPIKEADKTKWYPNYKWQLQTLNAIVESGPFIPQYNEEKYSTWELKYHYDFCFKWGGPAMPDKDVKDPKDLKIYDVPDKQFGRLQICNPAKQATETIFHPWDSRRGLIKETALKRMCQHLETDTEFQYSSEEASPKKKKARLGAALTNPYQEEEEIQKCLQTLCEKDTYQSQNQEIQDLIKQQQDHQQQLKYHILKLLIDLKTKQRQLQLHTGMVE